MREAYHILIISMGLACACFWLAALIGIITKANIMERWKQWLLITIPQAIVIVLALKELKWLQ
jgi:hypothetical protein